MITRSVASVDSLTWQEQLTTSIRDPKELLNWLELDTSLIDRILSGAVAADKSFSLRVPMPWASWRPIQSLGSSINIMAEYY